MKLPSRSTSLKVLLGLGALFAIPAFYQTMVQIDEHGFYLWRSRRLFLLIGYFFNVAGAVVSLKMDTEKMFPKQAWNLNTNVYKKTLAILSFVVSISLLPILILLEPNPFIARGFPMLWAAWWLALLGAWGLWLGFRVRFQKAFVTSLLLIGVVARISAWFPTVSSYPFSMGWSEASRYYYASLVFAKQIYGTPLALSVWHPSRYLLQALPFAFSGLPLWFHRLWQVILWIAISGASGFALANRIAKKKQLTYFLFAAWFFMYLFQGAVYYHLQISLLIILFGVKHEKPWQSFIAILFASFWAGISRLNWYPVPAMFAIALHVLEEPVSLYRNIWSYIKKPVIWAITGLLTALISQSFYIFWSGNSRNIASFSSSFTSSLLWYRLLPNSTNPLGIVPPLLFVSAPVVGIIISALSGRQSQWHWCRLLILWAMLGSLLVGGLVVSTKIGGGGDLHNMDAYLVLVGIWASYLLAQKPAGENTKEAATNASHWGWIMLAVGIPLWFSLQAIRPMPQYDLVQAEKSLHGLRDMVMAAEARGEEVLFINQRHLLAFDLVGEISLVEDYELITLMEMAMSGNSTYLNNFYRDLQDHRFSLIIASPQFLRIKTADEAFAEENNAWVMAISQPLLCQYEVIEKYKKADIHIFAPKENAEFCKFGDE